MTADCGVEMINRIGDDNMLQWNGTPSILDICFFQDKIYFLGEKGGLFVVDISKEKITFLGQVKGYDKANYLKIHVLNQDTLLFVPCCYGDIVQYRINEGDFHCLHKAGFADGISCMPWKDMLRYRDKLFFLGLDSKAGILNMELSTGHVRLENRWKEEFYHKFGYKADLYFNNNACQVEDSFWVPLSGKNMIMKYDMEANKGFFYKIGKEEIQFADICYDGRDFWLSGNAPAIYKWNETTNETTEYREFPEEFQKRYFKEKKYNGWDSFFYNSFKWHDCIYFSPLRANMIIAMDLKKHKLVEVKKIENDTLWFPLQIIDDYHLYFCERDSETRFVCNYCISCHNEIEDGLFRGQKIVCSEKAFINRKVMGECYPGMLADYIKFVENQKNDIYSMGESYQQKWKDLLKIL